MMSIQPLENASNMVSLSDNNGYPISYQMRTRRRVLVQTADSCMDVQERVVGALKLRTLLRAAYLGDGNFWSQIQVD